MSVVEHSSYKNDPSLYRLEPQLEAQYARLLGDNSEALDDGAQSISSCDPSVAVKLRTNAKYDLQ